MSSTFASGCELFHERACREQLGHDAEVTGPEACVMVDFGEIGDYAKRDN